MMKKVFLFCAICLILNCAPMAEKGSFVNNSSQIQSQVAPAPPPPSQPQTPSPTNNEDTKNDDDKEDKDKKKPELEARGEEFEGGSETEEVGDPPITRSL